MVSAGDHDAPDKGRRFVNSAAEAPTEPPSTDDEDDDGA